MITGWQREGNLWTAHLPEAEVGDWVFSALWADGAYRRPARTPNVGFYETAGKASPVVDPATGEESDRGNIAFRFAEGDIRHWSNLEDVLVVAMHSWDTSHGRIADIDDDEGVVTFTSPTHWPFEQWGPKQRYYVEHVFEALDRPGEWYLNRKTGVLYYWPMPGEDPEKTEIVVPVVPHVVKIEGDLAAGAFVEYLHLAGLRFAHTDHSLGPKGMSNAQAAHPVPGAIQADGAHHCSVSDCEIANVSNYAMWFRVGCVENFITRNHCHALGAGGVRIGSSGSPATDAEVTSHNVVDNNWLHDGGLMWPAAVGVWLGRTSHNRVSHNEISDFYYTGVSVGWSWGYAESSANHNTIEYNHIHHLGKRLLSDMGGIYLLGIAPGTCVRGNLIHDVFSYSYGGWGIYPDEGSTELLIEDNVVYNCKTGGFHQHYGRENRITNNIFAFSHEGQVIRSRDEEHISFFFEGNIVYFNNGQLLGSTWRNGNFRLDRNCYWDTSGMVPVFAGKTFEEWRETGQDEHSIIADPLFRDAEGFDFRLDPKSPAITELGFRPIDASKAGLYGPKKWVNGPRQVKHAPSELPTPPPPELIDDDFESTAVGDPPENAHVYGEEGAARIRVTDETAASGSHCLKFEDAEGLSHSYNPHMAYTVNADRGTAVADFDLRVGPGAILYHEWRTGGHPYETGPSFRVEADGRLLVGDVVLTTLPHGAWCRLTIACPLGASLGSGWSLDIEIPGKGHHEFRDLPCHEPQFSRLQWFGFVANGEKPACFFLDNVKLVVERDGEES